MLVGKPLRGVSKEICHLRQLVLALTVIGLASVASILSSNPVAASTAYQSRLFDAATLAPAGPNAAPVGSNPPAPDVSAARIIATAKLYLGYPYAWTGSEPTTGFSCIGLVYWVYYHENGVAVGRDVNEAYAMAPHISRRDLQPGDLVFFAHTVEGMEPLSHVAIYVGGGKMIAADSFSTGVEWDDLNDPKNTYWSDHYAGAARPLAGLNTVSPTTDSGAVITPTPVLPTDSGALTVTSAVTQSQVAATEPKGTILLVNAASLVVRSGAGDSYMEVGTVSAGTALTVTDHLETWYQVCYGDNQFGWVPAYAVARQEASSQQPTAPPVVTTTPLVMTATTAPPVVTATSLVISATADTGGRYIGRVGQQMAVGAAKLNLHAAPGLTTHVVAQLDYGARVVIVRVQRDWDQIHTSDGATAWVYSHYLSSDLTLAARTRGADGTNKAATSLGKASTKVAGFKQTSSYRIGRVMAEVLVVRAAPSTTARLVTKVKRGDRLRVMRSQHNWLYVVVRGGRSGWVSARWVA